MKIGLHNDPQVSVRINVINYIVTYAIPEDIKREIV